MDNIIGLGAAGCRIADEFAKYPQYTVYKIDVGLKGNNCFSLDPKYSSEEYERSVPDLSSFFGNLSGDILFVLGGGGKISGTVLQILKQLRHCNINILYIKPYEKSLTKSGVLHDRLTFHVLQEYARSGLFNRMFLVHNLVLEEIVGDVPILEYNKAINSTIVNCFHYFNIFIHTQSVIENKEMPKEIQRICTLGIYDIANNKDVYLFPLKNVGYKCYYYGIPDQVLKSDGKLFKLIKDKAAEDNSSYEVHTTKHVDSFCYFVAQSSFIQTLDIQ